MFFLRWLALLMVLIHRGWRRARMFLLRFAFHSHGKHFYFDPDGYYSFHHIDVGDYVGINRNPVLMAADSRIKIGNKVMIGYNVTIIGGNHNTSMVGQFMYDTLEKRPKDDQDVIIEDDVWLCSGVTILKGVTIGRGSIVAAGSVVSKNVLPYSIVGGVPARKYSMRFNCPEVIMEHEEALYPCEQRLSRAYLDWLFGNA